MTTTVIRNADWVIAWNEAAGHHFYRRGIDIVFVDDTITFVGRNYPGAADRVIDGRDRLVLPGLIDIHSPFIKRREDASHSALRRDDDDDREPVSKFQSKDYMDSYVNPPEFLKDGDGRQQSL